jgi:hypothetical protein
MEKAKVKRAEIGLLGRSIFELTHSCPTMKGKIVFALSKNEGKIQPFMKAQGKKQQEILDKYVKTKGKGDKMEYVLTEPTEEEIAKGARPEYVYKSKDGPKKAEDEMNKFMDEEVEIELHKVWQNDFENLDIVPSRNENIGMFIKLLVSENPDPQLTKV